MFKEKASYFLEKALLLVFGCFFIFAPYETKYIGKASFACGIIGWLLLNGVEHKGRFLFRLIPSNPLNKPVFFFIVASAISVLVSANPYHSQGILFDRYLMYFVLFYLGMWLSARNAKNLYFLALIFGLSAFIFSAGGVRDYIYYRFFIKNISISERLWSVFSRRIPYYGFPLYLVYFMPFAFAIFIFARRRLLKIIAFFVSGLLFLCLLWNASRAAWLSILLSLAFVIFMAARKKRMVTALLSLALLISLTFYRPETWKRIETTVNPDKWSNRIQLYHSAISIFKDYPLFGAGLGMYETLLRRPKYELPKDYPVAKELNLHAHNTYLELAAEMGLAGILSFLSIFAVFLVQFRKRILNQSSGGGEGDAWAVFLGFSAAILAVMVFAFSSTIITVGVNNSVYFWFLFGMTSGFLSNPKPGAQH